MAIAGYYYLQHDEDPSIAVAIKAGVGRFSLSPSLVQSTPADRWVEPELTLGPGRIVDYMASNVPLRLCSSELQRAIGSHAFDADALEWLPVKLRDGAGRQLGYSALRVEPTLEILDLEKSTMVGEHVVKAIIDPSKGRHRSIVMFPGDVTRILISSDVRRSILLAGCTGISFARVASTASLN